MAVLAFWLLFMTSHSETKQIFADVSIWHRGVSPEILCREDGEGETTCLALPPPNPNLQSVSLLIPSSLYRELALPHV